MAMMICQQQTVKGRREQRGRQGRSRNPMKIAVIGTGNVGKALGGS
jgi:predicted GTPase